MAPIDLQRSFMCVRLAASAYDADPGSCISAYNAICLGRFSDPYGVCSGFICETDEAVFIVFRGSANLKGWLTDARTSLTSRPEYRGQVHYGFANALDPMLDSIEALLPANRAMKPIYVTGHSLGGAIALLFAAQSPRCMGVITFGAPRTGDSIFAASIKCSSLRWVNGCDPLTFLPLTLMGYQHAPNLAFMRSDGTIEESQTWWESIRDNVESTLSQHIAEPFSLWPDATLHSMASYVSAVRIAAQHG